MKVLSRKNVFSFALACSVLFVASCSKEDDELLIQEKEQTVKLTADQQRRENETKLYVDSLNQAILSGDYVPNLVASKSSSRISSASYYIKKGNDRQTVYLHFGIGGFSGYPVSVYNSTSSATDVNYSVYKANTDGTLSTKLGGKYWDIHAGETSTKYFLSSNGATPGGYIAVVIENDGYIWQNNVPVSGTVTTP